MIKRRVELKLSEGATEMLRKLPFEDQKRLYGVILSLRTDPFPARAEKIPMSESYRITVGAFRILYEMEGTTVRVEAIRSILAGLI